MSSLFEDALGHADVLSQFTRPGQGTIDATNQMVDAIGMIQAEDRATNDIANANKAALGFPSPGTSQCSETVSN